MAQRKPLSTSISDGIAARISAGDLMAGDRLPSETDLAEQFDCSRATVREALKRLAARNLIRTARGASGGAFITDLTYSAALDAHVSTSTLLLSVNAVDFQTAAEARFALERACADLAAANRQPEDLARLRGAIDQLSRPIDDVAFCAADVAFHRALVDAARNPVLSYQLAGAVEAMQPLMNMLTYKGRDRETILALYRRVLDGLEARAADEIRAILAELEAMMIALFHAGRIRRRGR